MMKIIITGSTGMIGLALIELLHEKHEVIAIVRPDSPNNDKLYKYSDITIIPCDISNLKSLKNKISHGDLFFHLAWSKTYGTINRNDIHSQLKNIEYTLDATQLAYDIGCHSFVGAGSQAEFGIHDKLLTENTNIKPITGYGIAKYAAGNLSRIFSNQLGIKHCWTRILSVYGPGDNNSLIGSLIKSILKNEKFDTTPGEQIWNYIYSIDCARALYKIAIYGKNNKTYIISGEEEKQLKEYILKIRDLINPEYEIGFGKRKYNKNQVKYMSGDISQLKKDTGFKIKYSFEEGILETINYFIKQ